MLQSVFETKVDINRTDVKQTNKTKITIFDVCEDHTNQNYTLLCDIFSNIYLNTYNCKNGTELKQSKFAFKH